MDPARGRRDRRSQSPLRYAGLGVQLAVTLLACVLGGQWLDRRLGTDGLFVIVGAFLGFAGTLYWLIRQLRQSDGPPDPPPRPPRDG